MLQIWIKFFTVGRDKVSSRYVADSSISRVLFLRSAEAPSRQRQTRREAGAQSYGSGQLPDSRATEGRETHSPTPLPPSSR